jgi:hypothetical protein
MISAWNTVGMLALGALGWLGTAFVGRPLRYFFDLRAEVIHKSVLYDNVRAAVKEPRNDEPVEKIDISEEEMKRLQEAQDAFRDLAARMRAFALNEHLAVWLVKWRYDPWKASEALLRVSNTLHRYGGARANAKSELERALSFRITV